MDGSEQLPPPGVTWARQRTQSPARPLSPAAWPGTSSSPCLSYFSLPQFLHLHSKDNNGAYLLGLPCGLKKETQRKCLGQCWPCRKDSQIFIVSLMRARSALVTYSPKSVGWKNDVQADTLLDDLLVSYFLCTWMATQRRKSQVNLFFVSKRLVSFNSPALTLARKCELGSPCSSIVTNGYFQPC